MSYNTEIFVITKSSELDSEHLTLVSSVDLESGLLTVNTDTLLSLNLGSCAFGSPTHSIGNRTSRKGKGIYSYTRADTTHTSTNADLHGGTIKGGRIKERLDQRKHDVTARKEKSRQAYQMLESILPRKSHRGIKWRLKG